jgi:hypothetical protein
MRKVIVLSIACLVCLAAGCGCVSETGTPANPEVTAPGGEATPFEATLKVSNLIAEILRAPDDYLGATVEITGYFHGWDLLDEVGEPPPVTRSDWVIADEGGALYVTGMLPAGLNPASRDDVGSVIHLTATVATRQEQVYLEAQSIEVLTEH